MDRFTLLMTMMSSMFLINNNDVGEDDPTDAEEEMFASILNAGMLSLLHEEYSNNVNSTYDFGEFVYSRNRHIFFRSLSNVYRRIRSHHIPRCALLLCNESPWNRLYLAGNESALITCTGLNYVGFHNVLEAFTPLYNALTPNRDDGLIALKKTGGRKRLMDSAACLGLVLFWTRTRGALFNLSLLFGIIQSTCSVYLRFGRRILCHVLCRMDEAKVKMPDYDKIELYKAAVAAKHPTLGSENVVCAVDGCKLQIEQSGDRVIQHCFYNGWTHDHYVTNVFVFAPDGTIIAMAINAPGCMHDSSITQMGDIYDKLEHLFLHYDAKTVGDSAYMAKDKEWLIQSSQTVPDGDLRAIRLHYEATSFRQMSEWGMRAFQSSFPRIKDRLVYEEVGERLVVLKLLALLLNYYNFILPTVIQS